MTRTFSVAAFSFWNRTRTPGRSPRQHFQPTLESLGDRVLPATGLIGGTVHQDYTGNGLSADDYALANVTVQLYRDSNNNGALDGGDKLVAKQLSATDGSYSFGNLSAGRYFVSESVPNNFVLTAPTTASDYVVNLGNGQQVGGQDFDNFQKLNTSVVTNVSFTVIAPNGTQTTVTDLRGHTKQGDSVVANFTIAQGANPVVVSLVSYNAPGSSFDANTASQQTILAVATGTFGAGPHSLTVQLPNNFYQVDFIVGQAIDHFGPAGSNVFFSAEGRLLSADNGGKNALSLGSLSGTVTDTSGNVLPGAAVIVTNLANGSQIPTTTNAQGVYSLAGLQAGLSYSITTSDTGFEPQTTTLMLAKGSNTDSFSLVSTVQFASLSGTAVDASGNPLVGATVALFDVGKNFVTSTQTDSNGNYSFSGLQPGFYTVTANTSDSFYSDQTTDTLVAGSNTLNLTLT